MTNLLAYAAGLLALAPCASLAQACLGDPIDARAVSLSARYAHLSGARDAGAEAAVPVSGPLVVSGRIGRREFDIGQKTLSSMRGDAAYVLKIHGVSLCPIVGVGRESYRELDITLVPIGAALSLPLSLGRVHLLPYVVPGIVRSRASVLGQTRASTDFDLRVGATLPIGPYHLGAGWERRFTGAVDGAVFVRVGRSFALNARPPKPMMPIRKDTLGEAALREAALREAALGEDSLRRVAASADSARLAMHADSIRALEAERREAALRDSTRAIETLTANVFFDFNSANLRADAIPALRAKVDVLLANPAVSMVISAFADERGSAEYNTVISARRAAAVKQYFVDAGIRDSRIDTRFLGSQRPVCAEANESCWSRNRRVEFQLVSGGAALRFRQF